MMTKVTLALSFLSLATFLGGMLLARWGMVPPVAGLALFALGGVLGMASVGAALAVMFMGKGYSVAMVGMLGALPFIALLGGALSALQYPAINDIATDLDTPPGIAGESTPPQLAADIIRKDYPGLVALNCDLPPKTAYAQALSLARASHWNWTITEERPDTHTFHGVAITGIFHFEDDFTVRVVPTDDGGSRIDMRSKSRVGKSDLGANARRIRRYLEALAPLLAR